MWIAARIFRQALLKLTAAAFSTAFMAGLISPTFALAAAIRIMPLGDSITVGSSSGTLPAGDSRYYISYRKPLRYSLVPTEGYDINYVGSQTDGEEIFADVEHEGHAGWFAAGTATTSILQEVNDFLTANPADIVLLHIGTNDISTGQNPSEVKNEIESILNAIDAYEQNAGKDIWVVLALIINRATGCPYRSQTTSLNTALETMADNRRADGDKIVVVDMEAAIDNYNIGAEMYDCVHPSAAGYEKMADEWLQGLLAILPTANAGSDQNANPGVTVNLDGTGSSDSRLGTTNTYAWRQTSGSPPDVDITGPDTLQASFTAPSVSGGTTLTFRLTITDDKAFSHSDACIVTVNGPPVAVAGADQVVNANATVTLDGTASTDPGAGGAIAEYQWVQTAGSPVVSLTGANTAKASFTAPEVGSGGMDLVFKLTVTDSNGAQDDDTCIVHVNGPPVARAGADRQVNSGAAVVLDGSQSTDADGLIAGYQWRQTGGSPLVSLTDAQTAQAKFTAPDASGGVKRLSFQLAITDDLGDKASDSVVVEVVENVQPVADAGEDQSVRPGVVVSLDGSGSTDPLNDVLSFQWVQTSGPIVVLSDATSIRPSFTAPSAVESEVVITFSLTVKDQGGLQSTDFCTVTVSPNQGSSGSGGGGGCFIITAGSRGRKEHTTDLK